LIRLAAALRSRLLSALPSILLAAAPRSRLSALPSILLAAAPRSRLSALPSILLAAAPRSGLLSALPSILLAAALPASAQAVRGRVVDHETRLGLTAVSIVLLGDDGQPEASALSDTTGTFFIRLPQPGRYGVRVERSGYREFRTSTVRVDPGEEVALELRMARNAVVASPISVIARRRVLADAGFDERIRFMRRIGVGYFITRAEVNALRVEATSDLLALLPGVSVTATPDELSLVFVADSARCAPAVYLDGAPLRGAFGRVVTPDLVQAIELYRGPAEVPAEFADPSGCGVVLLWTRRADGRSLPLRRAVVYAGMIALGLLLFAR
jgi:hypothetical protein